MTRLWTDLFRAQFALIVLSLAPFAVASEKFQVTLSGSVTAVDSALLNTFHVGDPFEFGFLLDTANFTGFSTAGTGYILKTNYFKIGSNYRATAPDTMSGLFFSRRLESGGTEQGFRIERHDMVAPAISGLALSDTYIYIGFDRPLGAPIYDQALLIGPTQLLQINDRSIVLQNSSLEYGVSDYKLVHLKINSMAVVPEPACGIMVLLFATTIARRRGRSTTINLPMGRF